MDATTVRIMLIYLIRPEDTSAEGQSTHGLAGNIPEKTLRRLGAIKTCLWICVAATFSLLLSHMSMN